MDKIIKSITLELDGKEIVITEEQARTLHAALADLLGEPKEKEKVHYVPYTPSWWPTWTTPTWPPYTITNTGTGDPSSGTVWLMPDNSNVKRGLVY